jgi:hypothetical protein
MVFARSAPPDQRPPPANQLAQECRNPHKNMVEKLNSCAKPIEREGRRDDVVLRDLFGCGDHYVSDSAGAPHRERVVCWFIVRHVSEYVRWFDFRSYISRSPPFAEGFLASFPRRPIAPQILCPLALNY